MANANAEALRQSSFVRRRSTWMAGASFTIKPHEPHEAGKAARLHVEPSGEFVAINRRPASLLGHVVPRLLRLNPMAVFVVGMVLYSSVAIIFSLCFFALGAPCFEIAASDFSWEEMLWLSVHTLSHVCRARTLARTCGIRATGCRAPALGCRDAHGLLR
jgi:hypothetical protein